MAFLKKGHAIENKPTQRDETRHLRCMNETALPLLNALHAAKQKGHFGSTIGPMAGIAHRVAF